MTKNYILRNNLLNNSITNLELFRTQITNKVISIIYPGLRTKQTQTNFQTSQVHQHHLKTQGKVYPHHQINQVTKTKTTTGKL
jgi:hypothetical protein